MTSRATFSRQAPLPADVLKPAATAAASVDAEARFPYESLEALRTHDLLGAMIPVELGGQGASTARVAAQCQALAAKCGASGMILAMHHVQVACLIRHGDSDWHRDFLSRVAGSQLLLASATSEAGVGGALRTSRCAIEPSPEGFSLVKQSSAMSFGRFADAVLISARSSPAANPNDQALAVLERGDGLKLQALGSWDAMGMRGTVTEPFHIEGRGAAEQILPAPFGDIVAQTMTPISHILWSAVWTGIAGDAVGRARAFLRKIQDPGAKAPAHGAYALTEAVELLQMAEARLANAIRSFDGAMGTTPAFAEAAAYNGLKTSVSEACLQAAQKAMTVCGFAGYMRSGPFSVERHLRDLSSAPLMIANARIRESAAWLLLTQPPSLGLDYDA